MTEKREQDLPFHLRGNYAPVTEERTVVDLAVEGTIPPELRGVYMRNGPIRSPATRRTGSSAMPTAARSPSPRLPTPSPRRPSAVSSTRSGRWSSSA